MGIENLPVFLFLSQPLAAGTIGQRTFYYSQPGIKTLCSDRHKSNFDIERFMPKESLKNNFEDFCFEFMQDSASRIEENRRRSQSYIEDFPIDEKSKIAWNRNKNPKLFLSED